MSDDGMTNWASSNGYSKFAVGDAGTAFLKRQLSESDRPMSSNALASVDFSAGRTYALLPALTELSRATQFDDGGIASRNLASLALAEIFYATGFGSSSEILFSEEWAGGKNDSFVDKYDDPKFFCDDGVYFWKLRVDGVEALLHTICMNPSPYLQHHFVSRPTVAVSLPDMQEITRDAFDSLVESTIAIAVRAFDGESHLVWLKDGRG